VPSTITPPPVSIPAAAATTTDSFGCTSYGSLLISYIYPDISYVHWYTGFLCTVDPTSIWASSACSLITPTATTEEIVTACPSVAPDGPDYIPPTPTTPDCPVFTIFQGLPTVFVTQTETITVTTDFVGATSVTLTSSYCSTTTTSTRGIGPLKPISVTTRVQVTEYTTDAGPTLSYGFGAPAIAQSESVAGPVTVPVSVVLSAASTPPDARSAPPTTSVFTAIEEQIGAVEDAVGATATLIPEPATAIAITVPDPSVLPIIPPLGSANLVLTTRSFTTLSPNLVPIPTTIVLPGTSLVLSAPTVLTLDPFTETLSAATVLTLGGSVLSIAGPTTLVISAIITTISLDSSTSYELITTATVDTLTTIVSSDSLPSGSTSEKFSITQTAISTRPTTTTHATGSSIAVPTSKSETSLSFAIPVWQLALSVLAVGVVMFLG
jgi:hypothetical protein